MLKYVTALLLAIFSINYAHAACCPPPDHISKLDLMVQNYFKHVEDADDVYEVVHTLFFLKVYLDAQNPEMPHPYPDILDCFKEFMEQTGVKVCDQVLENVRKYLMWQEYLEEVCTPLPSQEEFLVGIVAS